MPLLLFPHTVSPFDPGLEGDVYKRQAKTIGVEKDAHYFTAHWFERLTAALPDAKFTDATNMVNFLRAVKSKQELDYMGIAARIVEKAMGNAIHMMEPGVRENAVGAQIL